MMNNFDIESPNYEQNVVSWIKNNLEVFDDNYLEEDTIISNTDFKGMVIILATVNEKNAILIGLPKEDCMRVYYPKEKIQTYSDSRITVYVIDKMIWFYKETAKWITGQPVTVTSFGMDMTLPFLKNIG